jgi:hypothetical protein
MGMRLMSLCIVLRFYHMVMVVKFEANMRCGGRLVRTLPLCSVGVALGVASLETLS